MTIEILPCGEETEWLVAEGHVDFTAFTIAAKAEANNLDLEVEDDDWPEPRHAWWRPIRRSDCETDEEFLWKESEDWRLWADDEAEAGAEPITYVRFDW